jgi:hypothetical protein
VKKMRFSLKTLEQTYGLETGGTVRSVTANVRPKARTYGLEYDKGLNFHQVIP